jgi:hypothetical protein
MTEIARSETNKTAAFGGLALALLCLTWLTTPHVRPAGVFAERGSLLFPEFRDPNSAASLEVLEFDAPSASVRPFKVQNRNGRWTIPSEHDYPADAKDRLAQTAAALIALRRDDFASDNSADYERCGVLDPLDSMQPGLRGRGTRLTVRGAHDGVLADVIVGQEVPRHPGFRYIREPNQRRVYTSNIGDLKISTAFFDWIDRDLLQLNSGEIDAVNLRNYSLDRRTGRVEPGETLLLEKNAASEWALNGLSTNERIKPAAVQHLLSNLAALRITGVLPKPSGISATLSRAQSSAQISADERADLAREGFYLASTGQLISDRGEIVVRTNRGVFYTLRFGDLATEHGAGDGTTPAENRYLFIMADFDERSASTPDRAAEGTRKANLLRTRFASWYYIIDAGSFNNIRLSRKDLVSKWR